MIPHLALMLLTLVTPPTACNDAKAFWEHLHSHNLLSNTARDHDIPPNAPFRLRTDFFASVIRDVTTEFPGQLMEVKTDVLQHVSHVTVTCDGPNVASVTATNFLQYVWAVNNFQYSPAFNLQFNIAWDPRRPFERERPFSTAHYTGGVRVLDNYLRHPIEPDELHHYLVLEPFLFQAPHR